MRAGSGAKRGPDPAGPCKPEVKGREKSRMPQVFGLTNWGDGGIVQWKRNTAEVQAVHPGHMELWKSANPTPGMSGRQLSIGLCSPRAWCLLGAQIWELSTQRGCQEP